MKRLFSISTLRKITAVSNPIHFSKTISFPAFKPYSTIFIDTTVSVSFFAFTAGRAHLKFKIIFLYLFSIQYILIGSEVMSHFETNFTNEQVRCYV